MERWLLSLVFCFFLLVLKSHSTVIQGATTPRLVLEIDLRLPRVKSKLYIAFELAPNKGKFVELGFKKYFDVII